MIFRAADGYISPSWYPSKHEHHQQVPTWNYSVVHAHGRIQIHDDARFVRRLLANLTRHHEAGEPIPWKMADAPRDYLETMVQAVSAQAVLEVGWWAQGHRGRLEGRVLGLDRLAPDLPVARFPVHPDCTCPG